MPLFIILIPLLKLTICLFTIILLIFDISSKILLDRSKSNKSTMYLLSELFHNTKLSINFSMSPVLIPKTFSAFKVFSKFPSLLPPMEFVI